MGMAPIVGVLLAWLYLNEETLSKIIHFLVQNPLSINFSCEHQMMTIKIQSVYPVFRHLLNIRGHLSKSSYHPRSSTGRHFN